MSELERIGFEMCLSDTCAMRLLVGEELAGIVVIHVDDMLFGGTSDVGKVVAEASNDTLPAKHLGDLSWYMGSEFRRDRKAGTIEISQASYIRSVLDKYNVSRKSPSPASPRVDPRPVREQENAAGVSFREVVGSLLWIANQTRPDISNAVRAVARHSHEP